MSPIPHIQINRTPLIMEYKTTPGKIEMEQPHAQITYNHKPVHVDLQVVSEGKLTINQDRAWDATSLGGVTYHTNHIYSQSKQVVMQALARIVADGNRMAQVTRGTVIHELHESEPLKEIPYIYTADASIDNVNIEYQRKEIEFTVDPAQLSFDVQVNPPRFQIVYPKFDAYVKQHNNVEIVPPAIDVKW